jgi:uncharacterized membrane protein
MDSTVQIWEPSVSERQGAAAAHVSGIFFPVLGPLVVFMLSGKSRFARYHALHSFVGMLLLNIVLFTLGAISVMYSLTGLWQQYQEDFKEFSIWPILIKSAVVWVVFLIIGLINTIVNVFQAYRAFQGHWPGGSLTTAIVNRFLGKPRSVTG